MANRMQSTIEYQVVTNDRGRTSLGSRMTELATKGWRYSATLHATHWGSQSDLGLVVLMEREVPWTRKREQHGE